MYHSPAELIIKEEACIHGGARKSIELLKAAILSILNTDAVTGKEEIRRAVKDTINILPDKERQIIALRQLAEWLEDLINGAII
jgi:DNA-directed RNA polymerase specialized sigma subunit